MSLGKAPPHEDLFLSSRALCEARLPESSIFRLLARDAHRLFPDDAFADLLTTVGRRSIPPRIVAVVMVLQRLHGLSDREAVASSPRSIPRRDMATRRRRADSTATRATSRSTRIHPKEETLARSRQRQKSEAWRANYRATRPKVERKFAHLMRHRHGGRRARVRGRERIGHDFALLAAGINLKRMAVLRATGRPVASEVS